MLLSLKETLFSRNRGASLIHNGQLSHRKVWASTLEPSDRLIKPAARPDPDSILNTNFHFGRVDTYEGHHGPSIAGFALRVLLASRFALDTALITGITLFNTTILNFGFLKGAGIALSGVLAARLIYSAFGDPYESK